MAADPRVGDVGDARAASRNAAMAWAFSHCRWSLSGKVVEPRMMSQALNGEMAPPTCHMAPVRTSFDEGAVPDHAAAHRIPVTVVVLRERVNDQVRTVLEWAHEGVAG